MADLECLDALREQFPHDVRLAVWRLASLAMLDRRRDRLKMLEETCARPDADPHFVQAER